MTAAAEILRATNTHTTQTHAHTRYDKQRESSERQHQHQSALNVDAAAAETVELLRSGATHMLGSEIRARNESDGAAVRSPWRYTQEASCWLSFASVTHNNAFSELFLLTKTIRVDIKY